MDSCYRLFPADHARPCTVTHMLWASVLPHSAPQPSAHSPPAGTNHPRRLPPLGAAFGACHSAPALAHTLASLSSRCQSQKRTEITSSHRGACKHEAPDTCRLLCLPWALLTFLSWDLSAPSPHQWGWPPIPPSIDCHPLSWPAAYFLYLSTHSSPALSLLYLHTMS